MYLARKAEALTCPVFVVRIPNLNYLYEDFCTKMGFVINYMLKNCPANLIL